MPRFTAILLSHQPDPALSPVPAPPVAAAWSALPVQRTLGGLPESAGPILAAALHQLHGTARNPARKYFPKIF